MGCKIVRDKNSKSISLVVSSGGGKWELYGGNSPDDIDLSRLIASGNGDGVFDIPNSDQERIYYRFYKGQSSVTLAERVLPLVGGFNFRDLGGYKGVGGREVKWGKIIRSDDLYNLTDDDLRYLDSIPIKSIVDFRSKSEKDKAPDKTPALSLHSYDLEIDAAQMPEGITYDDITREDVRQAMIDLNLRFVSEPLFIERYREFFQILANGENIPLLFHCSAGKDRTGMGAALILLALGVDEEVVMEDYMLSNIYLANKYSATISKYPVFEPAVIVMPEYIQAGLNKIIEEWGNIETFIREKLDVDIEKLRNRLLV